MSATVECHVFLRANYVCKNLDRLEPHNLIPPGVFTLDGLLKYGEEQKQCPYFTARRMVST
jgi:DNA excision repair protein ERCC-2